jgi:methylated-DNA-protein-cysteine methyltransferase related protein
MKKAKKTSNLGAYQKIWRVVSQIPKGKVASYGTVARQAGFPTQPRMAGYALHGLPDGIDIPWHRVVNSQGKISLGGEIGARQRLLLENEGVVFSNNRIKLELFGWRTASRPIQRKVNATTRANQVRR